MLHKIKMKNETARHTPESINAFVRNFQKIRILLTAFELDIFTILDKSPATSREVSEQLKTDARATDRLMNALCALGFLVKKEGQFANTEDAASFLVKGKPAYMGGLMHMNNLWDTWTTLTESVRYGTSAYRQEASSERPDTDWLESFIGAMHYRGIGQAPEVISNLDLNGVEKVLDVGGGSGVFAISFVHAADDITATVFDLPDVIPITQKFLNRDNAAARINTVSGDYHTDELPKGYDMVFLSAIIHSNSYDENALLVQKCASSLNEGGQLVIQDFVMNEDRTTPPEGAVFALNMLVGTDKGDTYTEKEIREWFEKAGIRFFKRIEAFSGNSMIVGKKL